jgi:hypothetical protein
LSVRKNFFEKLSRNIFFSIYPEVKREANPAKGFDSGVHQSFSSGFKLGFGRDWWEHSLTSLARIAFLAFFSIVFGGDGSCAKASLGLIALVQKSNALPM